MIEGAKRGGRGEKKITCENITQVIEPQPKSREITPGLAVLEALHASLSYSLGLPSAEGQVCVPEQWLRDWHTQAQVALALLTPTGLPCAAPERRRR